MYPNNLHTANLASVPTHSAIYGTLCLHGTRSSVCKKSNDRLIHSYIVLRQRIHAIQIFNHRRLPRLGFNREHSASLFKDTLLHSWLDFNRWLVRAGRGIGHSIGRHMVRWNARCILVRRDGRRMVRRDGAGAAGGMVRRSSLGVGAISKGARVVGILCVYQCVYQYVSFSSPEPRQLLTQPSMLTRGEGTPR